MISTTMSRILERKRALNISSAMLARLIDVSKAKMSDAERGNHYLSTEKEKELSDLTYQLLIFVEAVRPLKFPLEDTTECLRLLEHFRDNNVSPELVQQQIATIVGREERVS